jgi:TetR/AcrR family transcriptional regulator
MLYYYFGSKRGLFVAVLEQVYEQLRQDQHDIALRMSDPRGALRQLIVHTFDALWRDPDVISLINEENRYRAAHIKSSRVRDLYNPLIETLRYILQRGADEGVFVPGIDPVLVYLSLSSLCYHYISNQYTLAVALGVELGAESRRQLWLNHICDLVIQHCSAPSGNCDVSEPTPLAHRSNKKVGARRVA